MAFQCFLCDMALMWWALIVNVACKRAVVSCLLVIEESNEVLSVLS